MEETIVFIDEEKIVIKEFDKAWEEFFKSKPKPKNDDEDRKQQQEFYHWYNDIRKHTDTGKTPREMNKRIMEFKWCDSEEDYFVPLNELLVPETKETKKLKSIQGNKVEEYSDVIFPIESNIAEYFLDNQHIKDKDIKKALRNFIKNPFKEFEHSKFPVEYEIQFGASIGAQNKEISLHELKLIINFINLSIENRDYLPDENAYLKWLCAFLGYLDDKEIKKIEESYALFGTLNNIPKEEIDSMIKTLNPEKNKGSLK